MKLIGHTEALNTINTYLQPIITRQVFSLSAPEGVGRQVFLRTVFESLTRVTGSSSDYRVQTLLGVDDIREVISWSTDMPVQAKLKMLVVLPCENLTHAACNALLKLLEEPPPYLLIFMVGDTFSLPQPIKSRLTPVELKHLLRAQCEEIWDIQGISHSMFSTLWNLAPGIPGLALNRLTLNYPGLYSSWGKFLLNKPTAYGLLHWQDQIPKEWTTQDQRNFWLWLLPKTFMLLKDPTSILFKVSQEASEIISSQSEVSPRLLIPALWYKYSENN